MSDTFSDQHEPLKSPLSTLIRVGLIDDHEVVSVAIAHLCEAEPDLELVAVAPTVDELVGGGSGRLDVVLLDLRLADGSSPVRNVERLRATGARVLGYSSGENPFLVRVAAGTEMAGIVRKSEPVAVLIDAIRRTALDEPVVSADWAAALDADPRLDEAGLSAQEQRVLTLFASGVKAQAVAFRLGISPGTVDDYVRRIRAKYTKIQRSANTKVDLYKRALEDGFLPLPEARQPGDG